MKRVGLIGAGNIGIQLVQAVKSGQIPNAAAVAVMARSPEKARLALDQAGVQDIPVFQDVQGLLSARPDIVVEAAHPHAVQDCAEAVLDAGVDFMPMSVGGLIAPGFLEELTQTAQCSGAQLIVPAGAMTGLNVALAATAGGPDGLYEARITSTKSPAGLKTAPYLAHHPEIELDSLTEPKMIFQGNVQEAVSGFPQNVNVAAAVALCGLGPEKTQVQIIADPQVYLKGVFGETCCTLTLETSPNRRSSYLALLSGIATLKKYCTPIKLDY